MENVTRLKYPAMKKKKHLPSSRVLSCVVRYFKAAWGAFNQLGTLEVHYASRLWSQNPTYSDKYTFLNPLTTVYLHDCIL